MVVILGNTDIDPTYTLEPAELAPVLQVSNMPCWQWSGTVTMQSESPDATEGATAFLTLQRPDMLAPPPEPAFDFMPIHLGPLQGYSTEWGAVQWVGNGTVDGDCSYSYSDTWQLFGEGGLQTVNASFNGPWHRGYEGDGDHRLDAVPCQYSDGRQGSFSTSIKWFSTGEPGQLPNVFSGATNVSGSASRTIGVTNYSWTWSLESSREP